ncbi:MAG: DsbA family protein [Acidobacteriaceae bacterium]|nr:DsbA family protein [Acidobacteriaceae bacterium]
MIAHVDGSRETLLLSPDHRYLSREVLDTRPDLAAKETAQRDAIASMLKDASNRPQKGAANAPVRIDVFSDFECPYCRQEFLVVDKAYLPEHRADIRLIFHQQPLPNHPWARRAAELAECAYEQRNDLFWTAHDFLFENQNAIELANIDSKVTEALSGVSGFRPQEYRSCLAKHDSSESWPGIDADKRLAAALDVHSTPTLFINGLKIEGTLRPEQLDTLIGELQRQSGGSPELLSGDHAEPKK